MYDKRAILKKIKAIYDDGGNVIQYLRKISEERQNSIEDIMVSYDFQAGTYTKMMLDKAPGGIVTENAARNFMNVISRLNLGRSYSILEAGTGEASFLKELLPDAQANGRDVYGFDISWSRIKYACNYTKEYIKSGGVNLFVGDMFSIPLADDSIDVVFTSFAMEPNGGHERELMKELYRVTGKYLILQEPAYELASEEAQARMREHGYVRGLPKTAKDLSMDVVEYSLLPEDCCFDYNVGGIMIIRKDTPEHNWSSQSRYICPVTHTPLVDYGDAMFSKNSLLAYPKLAGIPMLTESNAIVATKFLDE